jgi:hypothetical protein
VGTQNFRVKKGVEVGSASTFTTTDAYIGTNLIVAGISTFQSDLFVAGALTAGSGGNGASIGDDIVTRNLFANGISTFTGAISGSSASFTADLDIGGHTELDELNVSGVSTFVGISTFQSDLYVGGTLYAPSLDIENGATLGEDLTTRNISASGIVTITGTTDLNGDLDVEGHTELDNLNVSGVSTFVGVTTTQDNLFVGNNLSVAGDARVVGVLTVGSGTITIDGDSNTINVGTGATLHTTTVSVNQLEVAGIATFKNNVDLGDNDRLRLGDDEDLQIYHNGNSWISNTNPASNLFVTSALGIQFRVNSNETALNATSDGGVELYYDNSKKFETTEGGIDVTGHTELDNVNISGVITATSAEFSGNVTVLGDLTYENVVNVDAIGIATARSGLRVTGGGLDVVGVATFNNNAIFEADLDVGGHTNLDDVSISGVTTVAGLLDANDGFVANQATVEDLTNTRVVTAGTGGRLQDSANLTFDGNTLHTTNANVSGIVTAGLFSGASQIGIQSNGLAIGVGITQLNFIGIGNTFVLNGTTVDVSISGGGGGGIGTAVDRASSYGGANIYYTDPVLTIDGDVTVDAPSTALASYTTYRDIMVLDEWDLIIEDDNFIVDILDFESLS